MSDLHTCTLTNFIWSVIEIRHRNSLCVFETLDIIKGDEHHDKSIEKFASMQISVHASSHVSCL